MKKRYQIDQQRAVQQFRRLATEENPNIQMILPMADIVGMLQDGVGHLLRQAGLALMSLVMEEEVRHLAGERHEQRPDRHAHRWGKDDGYCVVDGQKVPLKRTRLRTKENRERFLHAFLETSRRARIQVHELAMQLCERPLGRLIFLHRVGILQLPAHAGLVLLRQVIQHVAFLQSRALARWPQERGFLLTGGFRRTPVSQSAP